VSGVGPVYDHRDRREDPAKRLVTLEIQLYFGWFSGNRSELHKLPAAAEAVNAVHISCLKSLRYTPETCKFIWRSIANILEIQ